MASPLPPSGPTPPAGAPAPAPVPTTPAAQLRLRGLSIRVTWTSAVVALVLVPVVVLGVRVLDIQKGGLEAAEKASQTAVIDLAWRQVESLLYEAREATHQVGLVLTESRLEDAARLEIGREVLARASVLRHVAFYSPDGQFLAQINHSGPRAKAVGPAPAALRSLPAELLATPPKEGQWLPIAFGEAGAELRYVELLLREGERRGWAVGTLDARPISTNLAAIGHDNLGGVDRALLLDDQLRLVAGGGDLTRLGKPVSEKELLGPQLRRQDLRQDAVVSAEFLDVRGVGVVGTARLVKQNLVVAVRRPSAEVFRAVATSKNEFLRAGAAVVLLALVFGGLLAARVVRPVRQLAALTQAYARREFDARSTVRTGNELELLGDSMGAMAVELRSSEEEIRRRAGVERDLSRYLPAEVARAVVEGRQGMALGGEKRPVTTLFADVVSFTTFAESAPPEQVVALLNELFTVLSEVVFRHGGTLDKFIGDCAMAVFGAPDPQPDHAERALAAAEDMHRFVDSSAPAWARKYGFTLALGIGVSSGEAVVGNLGSELRMEYTAIGDVVNVAARLEAIARPGQTLLTREVSALAGDAFSYRSLGEHPLHGKQRPVEVLELA